MNLCHFTKRTVANLLLISHTLVSCKNPINIFEEIKNVPPAVCRTASIPSNQLRPKEEQATATQLASGLQEPIIQSSTVDQARATLMNLPIPPVVQHVEVIHINPPIPPLSGTPSPTPASTVIVVYTPFDQMLHMPAPNQHVCTLPASAANLDSSDSVAETFTAYKQPTTQVSTNRIDRVKHSGLVLEGIPIPSESPTKKQKMTAANTQQVNPSHQSQLHSTQQAARNKRIASNSRHATTQSSTYPTFTIQGGHMLQFTDADCHQAIVELNLPQPFRRRLRLRVIKQDPALQLADIEKKSPDWLVRNLHLYLPEKDPHGRGCIYVGTNQAGLLGGGQGGGKEKKGACGYTADKCSKPGAEGHAPPHTTSTRQQVADRNDSYYLNRRSAPPTFYYTPSSYSVSFNMSNRETIRMLEIERMEDERKERERKAMKRVERAREEVERLEHEKMELERMIENERVRCEKHREIIRRAEEKENKRKARLEQNEKLGEVGWYYNSGRYRDDHLKAQHEHLQDKQKMVMQEYEFQQAVSAEVRRGDLVDFSQHRAEAIREDLLDLLKKLKKQREDIRKFYWCAPYGSTSFCRQHIATAINRLSSLKEAIDTLEDYLTELTTLYPHMQDWKVASQEAAQKRLVEAKQREATAEARVASFMQLQQTIEQIKKQVAVAKIIEIKEDSQSEESGSGIADELTQTHLQPFATPEQANEAVQAYLQVAGSLSLETLQQQGKMLLQQVECSKKRAKQAYRIVWRLITCNTDLSDEGFQRLLDQTEVHKAKLEEFRKLRGQLKSVCKLTTDELAACGIKVVTRSNQDNLIEQLSDSSDEEMAYSTASLALRKGVMQGVVQAIHKAPQIFLQNFAHLLQNPLTTVEEYIILLNQLPDLPTALANYLDSIEEDAATKGEELGQLVVEQVLSLATFNKVSILARLGKLTKVQKALGAVADQKKKKAFRKGGGKNAPHAHGGAREAARLNYEKAKAAVKKFRKANPLMDLVKKKELAKLERQRKHWQNRMNFTGETHSRNAKGNN